jgi:hypothetical protein
MKPISDWTDKASGYILIDGNVAGCTMQCPHCNTHFLYRKGSGTLRGWCMRCNKISCGKEPCMTCIPFEAKLDFVDGGNGFKSSKWDHLILDFTKKYNTPI